MNKVSVIQGHFSQNRTNIAVLRSGTVVTGRVLERNADGSYSVSLAGQKINVKSESPLQIGGVFSARVNLKGESVELSLVKENVSSEILQKFGGSSEISPQVANLLASLGFEQNSDSFKILQFMQQIGMKFDVDSAKKALKQAKKSSDKEENAQISLLLEEKGIKANDERVQAVSGRKKQGESDKRKDENEKQGNLEVRNEKAGAGREQEKISNEKFAISNYLGKDVHEEEKILKAGRLSCVSVKDYFSQIDEAASSHDFGILTAFNSVLSSSQKNPPLRHWIMLPFEWNFRAYTGNIRLLFDSELKNLEKVVIDLKNPAKNHIFVLYYKNAEVSSVKFASDTEFSDSQKSHLCEVLSSMLSKKISVKIEDFASLKGFCAEDEQFSFLDGSA